jgi:hypothetical protein
MGLIGNGKQHAGSGQAGYHRLFHNASCVAKFIVIEGVFKRLNLSVALANVYKANVMPVFANAEKCEP